MLHVLNTRERNDAFGKFLGLFLITVFMVGIAVFLSWRTPTKINASLNDQLGKYRLQEAEQQNFLTTIDSAENLIELLDKPGSNVGYLNELIGKQLANLKEATMKNSNDNMYAEINKRVHNLFLHYSDAEYQLKDANKQIQVLESQLKKCKNNQESAKEMPLY